MKINPIFERENTLLFNDGWLFSADKKEWKSISLPFCPQSEFSGVKVKKNIEKCFYKKKYNHKHNMTSQRVFLRFGAVDYFATLFVNGKYVAEHKGGYTPFAVDITDFITEGDNELLLTVIDEINASKPSGKQTKKEFSYGCFYTQTIGIWQNVCIEYAPYNYIERIFFQPCVKNCSVNVKLLTRGKDNYVIKIFYGDNLVGYADGVCSEFIERTVPLSEKHLWEISDGKIYNVEVLFGTDKVYSYFGLREVEFNGTDFLLNGRKVFQKFVLQQGFYPDGIYTANSNELLEEDVKKAIELGFNGSRLHQKVFDPVFLYYCDVLGHLVWGEFPSWGVDYSNTDSYGQFIKEWKEVLQRDYNHPCIVTWCPLNEIWLGFDGKEEKNDFSFIKGVYDFTKKYDCTRPCIDVSGGYHCDSTDVFDFHSYLDKDGVCKILESLQNNDELNVPLLYAKYGSAKYKKGMPVMISECGGIAFSKTAKVVPAVQDGVDSVDSWGYGDVETDEKKFVQKYDELVKVISRCDKLSGFCYTQLYDIEQEQNGFYNYDRSDKLSKEQKLKILEINNTIR